jgi:hypothetical protein
MKLPPPPPGWTLLRFPTVFRCESEGLEIRRARSGKNRWTLLHNGKDTLHQFKTVAEAIEYAEDVRAHGH